MKKLLLFLIILVLYSPFFVQAQDAFNSNNVGNSIYTNPGFAGSKNMVRVSLDNQLTWYSAVHKTVYNSVSADIPINKFGLGFSGTYNVLSEGLNTTNGDLMLSYKIGKLRKFIIRPGIKASYFGSYYNFDKLIFYDQLSVYNGSQSNTPTAAALETTNFNLVDLSAGFVSQFPIDVRRTDPAWINFGFAMHHITNNEYASMGTKNVFYPKKYVFNAGMLIPMYHKHHVTKIRERSNIMFYPNFKYQLQGDFSLINVGMLAYLSPTAKTAEKGHYFVLGLAAQSFQTPSIYNKNQLVGTMGYEATIGNYLAVQLMYNLNWGSSFNLRLQNSPVFLTHEFSIVVMFANKRKTDCSKTLKYNKKRWYNDNELQIRHEGECPPGKTIRRTGERARPLFYPFELPKAYMGF